jgi:hypothetical protein
VTNDEVQENDAGLFAFDPIRRIDERREAMLADPNHTRKSSKDDAIPIAERFLSARGSIVSLKEPMSRLSSDPDVCENRCRYWTYSDWRKIPKEGDENGRASTSKIAMS